MHPVFIMQQEQRWQGTDFLLKIVQIGRIAGEVDGDSGSPSDCSTYIDQTALPGSPSGLLPPNPLLVVTHHQPALANHICQIFQPQSHRINWSCSRKGCLSVILNHLVFSKCTQFKFGTKEVQQMVSVQITFEAIACNGFKCNQWMSITNRCNRW